MARGSTYVFTRFAILRLLALVYAVAFLCLVLQLGPLIGSGGLLPAATFLARVRASMGSQTDAVLALPTLFWLDCSDGTMLAAAWLGLALSVVVLLGVTNALVLFVLWFLYLSFVQIGQLFYGYGWETQLLETGFLERRATALAHPSRLPASAWRRRRQAAPGRRSVSGPAAALHPRRALPLRVHPPRRRWPGLVAADPGRFLPSADVPGRHPTAGLPAPARAAVLKPELE